MKAQNRKKLASIAGRVAREQWMQMQKATQDKEDKDFAEALQILGDALKEIEMRFGNLD
jgi:hypothetical protein